MRILGTAVAMGGRDWVIPPLTLGQLRQLMPKVRQLNEIGASMGEAEIMVLVEIVTAALQRNYPDLGAAEVEDLLDLGNAGAVLNAVLTGSGLKPTGNIAGESSAPGATPGAATPNEATATKATLIGGSSSAMPKPAAVSGESSTVF